MVNIVTDRFLSRQYDSYCDIKINVTTEARYCGNKPLIILYVFKILGKVKFCMLGLVYPEKGLTIEGISYPFHKLPGLFNISFFFFCCYLSRNLN